MLELVFDLSFLDTAPVRPVAGTETLEPVNPVAQKIDTKEVAVGLVPYQVEDILNYEVWIEQCNGGNDIGEIEFRNSFCTIHYLVNLISEGYLIYPWKPSKYFYQQMLLFEYNGDISKFKQTSLDNNVFPTFIIEHKRFNSDSNTMDNTAILGYLFRKPIKNIKVMKGIHDYLTDIMNYPYCGELYNYCTYDYGKITNVTITNNIYIPVKGGIAHE